MTDASENPPVEPATPASIPDPDPGPGEETVEPASPASEPTIDTEGMGEEGESG